MCLLTRRTVKSGERNFYSGCVRRNGHVAIIFISPDILPSLNTSDVILMDATFKVVPSYPPELRQLMTLSVVTFDQVNIVVVLFSPGSNGLDCLIWLEHCKSAGKVSASAIAV